MTRLSRFVGTPVESESGEKLGRIFDLQAEQRGDQLRVITLLVGKFAFLERLGYETPRSRDDRVAWEDVLRIEPKRIVVRDQRRAR
jgi:sporulation protein YlmC with PRC-barrel domain